MLSGILSNGGKRAVFLPKRVVEVKKYCKKVDRAHKIAYNRIMEIRTDKKTAVIIVLRCLAVAVCLLYVAWIFSNSLKTAAQSIEQSGEVTDGVAQVFKWLAPNSFWANASKEELEVLHAYVREGAHFLEFALLGALCSCVFFAFQGKGVQAVFPFLGGFFVFQGKGLQALFPFLGGLFVGVIDEILQLFSKGRAFEWTDILIDFGGVLFGCSLAFFVATAVVIYAKKRSVKV